MKKTSLYAALLACSLTLAGAAFQTANAAIVMRAGHDSPETVPVAKGLAYWADLVNKRTNGEVQIQVFNNGTVGSASDYGELPAWYLGYRRCKPVCYDIFYS